MPADRWRVQESWIIVVLVALSPFVVAAAVWFGITAAHRLSDRRLLLASLGPSVVVSRGRRSSSRVVMCGLAVVVGLKVLVASMSWIAAWSLAAAIAGFCGLIVLRGAVEPSFGVDDAAFDHELRSFLDDAA